MQGTERHQAVLDILKNLHDTKERGLKELFWTELNYERDDKPLSTRQWPDSAKAALAGDPVLFASGGEDNAFHVVHCRLASEALLRGLERPVVNQLLREHPYALFVFTNQGQTAWHFLNVKYSEKSETRKVFRRIVVQPGAGLRTAAERISLLDLEKSGRQLFAVPPLAIQSQCDEAFDVEAVTKSFFREVANWYFWALKKVRFPKDAPKESDGHDHISVIRLITRLIFCWFIKEKGLLPAELFDERFVADTLNGFNAGNESDKGSVYYRAVLQNLFFATLNTEMDKRGWAKDEQNFMAHSLYRHKECFAKPAAALDLFKNIPFLNGGLFECLDKDRGESTKPRYVRIDGFSRRPDSQPVVPDFLFFGDEREVDLSADYGERKFSRVRVRGLIHTFNQYRFTITENTPIDQEVALDPELSGKVFENLLAAYNPETGATARKATGSFYTPREIVSYMTDEALIAHLRDKLATESSDAEEKLRELFAYDHEGHRFNEHEVELLIAAIDNTKVIDPAVGSGAFPMGVLHKLVFILGKLDPHNEKWKERQIGRVRDELRLTAKLEDAKTREATSWELEQKIGDIEEAFAKNDLDYGRKLYLIENCIFGVDIQSIAVQIAKMRFFISLVVDQKLDPAAQNLGVRPLPNLETKFVAANTLIGVTRPGQMALRNLTIDAREAELRRVRERHFMARTLAAKRKCREQDSKLRSEIAKLLETDGWDSRTARMLSSWDPYDQNASAPFFDPEWMFGICVGKLVRRGAVTLSGMFSAVAEDELAPRTVEECGFDAVIGNPPYVRQEQLKELKPAFQKTYECYTGTADLYVYFYERAVKLLRQGGVLSFISSNKWYRAAYGEKLRTWLPLNTRILRLIDFGDAPVFTAIAYPTIVVARRGAENCPSQIQALNWNAAWPLDQFIDHLQTDTQTLPQTALKSNGWQLGSLVSLRLLESLRKAGKPLREYVGNRVFRGITTGFNDAFVVDHDTRKRLIAEHSSSKEILKPFLRGRDVKRWECEPQDLWLIFTRRGVDIKEHPAIHEHLKQFKKRLMPGVPGGRKPGSYEWYEIQDNIAYWQEFEKTKIISTKVSIRPTFALDRDETYLGNTSYFIPVESGAMWLMAVLNSVLFYAYAKRIFVEKQGGWYEVQPDGLEAFPIPPATPKQQSELERLVDRILAAKKADPAAEVGALEREIDERVYRLYGLTKDEIRIVEEGA